ncbi:unnamed protein product [Rangifer tarandus platyrhynchus]|uniref:Uncharacterized protein n=2 Tax=Rangifer tarandus platyrhynchus TaxID=3082113 RepID=A0AC59Z0T1_RANTA|nr:unnamed protein product [Rangifer tarandus platyrhynchus]
MLISTRCSPASDPAKPASATTPHSSGAASAPVVAWTGNCGCGGSYNAVCGHHVGLSTQNGATDYLPVSISESGTSSCWGDECPEDAPRRANARSPPAGSHSALA